MNLTHCGVTFPTVNKWKRHMSTSHGGYTEEELQIASGVIANVIPDVLKDNVISIDTGSEGIHASGEDSFESMAASMPETAAELNAPRIVLTDEPEPIAAEQPSAPPPSTATVNKKMRKMKAKMEKMKKKMAGDIPNLIFNRLAAERGEDWKLDQDETETIAESIETVFDIMGVEFEIEPWNIVLKSKLWLIFWPITVILFTFLMKLSSAEDKTE